MEGSNYWHGAAVAGTVSWAGEINEGTGLPNLLEYWASTRATTAVVIRAMPTSSREQVDAPRCPLEHGEVASSWQGHKRCLGPRSLLWRVEIGVQRAALVQLH
eukprot:3940816-Rhodomonas_salina.2